MPSDKMGVDSYSVRLGGGGEIAGDDDVEGHGMKPRASDDDVEGHGMKPRASDDRMSRATA